MKIMAVDYGDARTGLAVCDRTETLASPIGVIHERDFAATAQKVSFAVREYDVKMVVVGYPKNMNGTEGERCEKTKEFRDMLVRRVNLPVELWDERLTTVAADNIMTESNITGERRKEYVDEIAAMLILQGYLDYLSNQSKKEE